MRRARALAIAALLLGRRRDAAHARVIGAETVLPPGQSGFVSIAGVTSGTGSPHLNDQTGLFTSFRYKSALFNQAGATDHAEGRGEDRARALRRARDHRRQRLRRLVGRGLRGGAGPAVPARAVPPRHQRPAGRDPGRLLPRRRPDRPPRLLHRRRAGPDDRRDPADAAAARRGLPRRHQRLGRRGAHRPGASCRASSPRWRWRCPPGRCATPRASASSSPARCRRATAARSRTPAR